MEDKIKLAIPYLDLLFPEFPEYDDFDLYKFIPSTKLSKEEKQQAHKKKSEVEILMVDIFHYADRNNVLSIHLNEKGREAKSHGGHVMYQQWLKSQSSLQSEGLELQVQKLREDVFDYPETKKRAKDGIFLARLSVGIALITLLLQLLCNKPH